MENKYHTRKDVCAVPHRFGAGAGEEGDDEGGGAEPDDDDSPLKLGATLRDQTLSVAYYLQ